MKQAKKIPALGPTSFLNERDVQRWQMRSPKTLEWHRIALGLFGAYLVSACQLVQPADITQSTVERWMAFLRMTPTRTDAKEKSREYDWDLCPLGPRLLLLVGAARISGADAL